MEESLKRLLKNSYSPYSGFKVAAICLMKDGKSFGGVNVENASYGATICDERVAINNAIASGYILVVNISISVNLTCCCGI